MTMMARRPSAIANISARRRRRIRLMGDRMSCAKRAASAAARAVVGGSPGRNDGIMQRPLGPRGASKPDRGHLEAKDATQGTATRTLGFSAGPDEKHNPDRAEQIEIPRDPHEEGAQLLVVE